VKLDDPEYPALQSSFDRSSTAAQTNTMRLTRGSLFAGVVAAAAGVVAGSDGADWGAIVALLAFLAGAACQFLLVRDRPERGWYDARAGAESVKTLSWQYAVGATPFAVSVGDDDAQRRLTGRFRELLDSHAGLKQAPRPDGRQLTDWMKALRHEPLDVRRSVYDVGRLLDQVRWYGEKATANEALARRWSLATLGLQAAGILAATLRATDLIQVDLMGLAAAAAASGIAWLASKDHAGLAEAYATTAHELVLVRDNLPTSNDEVAWATFVSDAEAAISREHTRWLARRRAVGSLGAAGRSPRSS
jgi:hypothetical protein